MFNVQALPYSNAARIFRAGAEHRSGEQRVIPPFPASGKISGKKITPLQKPWKGGARI
jgi:hypothetical protein